MATSTFVRQADPYRDLAVIDARAPRFNQTVVAVVSIITLLSGAWPLVGVLGAQLAVSVLFGRQYCVPCLFYFSVIQPRLGEGKIEDSRAPRFANILGAVFLTSAAVAWGLGFTVVGQALILLVAGLASLAALSGLCVGCEVYRLIALGRGIRGGLIDRLDLEQLGVAVRDELVVLFTHPLCADCHEATRSLERDGRRVLAIDVSSRRDLAKKYGVTLVPLAVTVGPDGRVLQRSR